MAFLPLCLLILLGIALTSLGYAAHLHITIWTVLSTLLAYTVVCIAILAYGHKILLERRASHATPDMDTELSNLQIEPVLPISALSSAATTHSNRQQIPHSPHPHPNPLASNPLNGPDYGSTSNISIHNLSNSQDLSIPAFPFQTSSTTTFASDDDNHHQPIQMPARTRAATDTGITAQKEAAKRTRANSLVQIRQATARRMTVAGNVPPPRQDAGQ